MGKLGKKKFDETGKLISADAFVFYKSWLDVADLIDDEHEKLEFLLSILNYGIHGREPSEDCSILVRSHFVQIRTLIDIQAENYRNGVKGGRPKKQDAQQDDSELGLYEKKYASFYK